MYAKYSIFFPTSLLIYYIIKNLLKLQVRSGLLGYFNLFDSNEMEQLISFLGLIFLVYFCTDF